MGKMVIAVPLWFGMFAANLLFANKVFGNSLLPFIDNLLPEVAGGGGVSIVPAKKQTA